MNMLYTDLRKVKVMILYNIYVYIQKYIFQ